MNERMPAERVRDEAWQQKHREILTVAAQLFETVGFEGTTVKAIARGVGCSVGYLYKHFAGKQELLDGLMLTFLDEFETIRRQVRREERLKGLACLRRELGLMCELMVDHRGLIGVYAERESHCSSPLVTRMQVIRVEDRMLLDEARLAGEVPDMDPSLLAAVIDGAIWSVLKLFARTERSDNFLLVPRVVDQLVFTPMERQARDQGRQKESLT